MMKLNLQLFAVSTSKSKNLYSTLNPNKYPYTLTASMNENSVDQNNNTSNVTIIGSLKANQQRWADTPATLTIALYNAKTNEELQKQQININGLSTLTETKSVSSTFDVEHDLDGTLNVYAKATFDKGSATNPYAPKNGNVQTNSIGLTTIPRVSDVACTSPFVGDVAIITITRKATDYTDTIKFEIGNLTGTLVEKTKLTTLSLNTNDYYSQIYELMGSSNKSIQGKIIVETFNQNDKSIGTKQVLFNIYAKEDDCKPNLDFDLVTTDLLSQTLTGNNKTIINFISDCSISYETSPKNGALLVNTILEGYGEVSSSPINVKLASGKVSMISTDTRGFSTKIVKDYNFIDYVEPKLTFTANRTSKTDSEVEGSFNGTFFNNSFGSIDNTLELKVIYKEKNSTDWLEAKTLIKDVDYTINNNNFYSGTASTPSIVNLGDKFLYNKNYDIAIAYEDKIKNNYISQTIVKSNPVLNWKDSLVNVNGNFTISDKNAQNPINVLNLINSLGVIVEQATNELGTYVKFSTGLMITFQEQEVNANITSVWGSIFSSGSLTLLDYPKSFIDVPETIITKKKATGNGTNFWIMQVGTGTKDNPGTYQLLRGTSVGNVSAILSIIGIGMWK